MRSVLPELSRCPITGIESLQLVVAKSLVEGLRFRGIAMFSLNSTRWMKLVTEFDQLFTNVVGNAAALFERAAKSGRRWYRGQVACDEAFG